MILRIFPPCQRPWSLVFGVGSRVCVCERRTGLKYWRQRCSHVRVHITQFCSKKKLKKTRNISIKQVKSKKPFLKEIILYMILVKTETKGTLKVCWQCDVHDQSMIGRYEKRRVNVLTTIMTD